ncbi:hypothetical protein TcYC6_0101090 [Trypanosoma cruzi]|nr:hypothetical protein TcYC6_0101090 [Trypanosoma cruzi]
MTANLIGLWLQRMWRVRRYALGVALTIGDGRRHDIVALCVLRGWGMPAVVEETELFDWEELVDFAAQRERMAAACAGGARVEMSVACLWMPEERE